MTTSEKWNAINCASETVKTMIDKMVSMTGMMAVIGDIQVITGPISQAVEAEHAVISLCVKHIDYCLGTDDSDAVILAKHEELHTQLDKLVADFGGAMFGEAVNASHNPFDDLPDFDLP